MRLSSPLSTLPGPDLEEARARVIRRCRSACTPPSAPATTTCSASSARARVDVAHRQRRGVGDHREARRAERAPPRARHGRPGHRRGHQRRVERPAHLEREHALGARGLAGLAGAGHGGRIAGDHGLVGRVEVGRHRHLAARSTPPHSAPSTSAAPRPSTAAIAPARACPASSISSPRRRTTRAPSVGVERAGRDVRAVLAQAVPGRRHHAARAARPTTAARRRCARESRAARCASA